MNITLTFIKYDGRTPKTLNNANFVFAHMVELKVTSKGIGIMACISNRADYSINAAAEKLVECLDEVINKEHDFRTTEGYDTKVYQTVVKDNTSEDISLYELEIGTYRNKTVVQVIPLHKDARSYLKRIVEFYKNSE